MFLACPAERRFLRIVWNLFVHKKEKYIVFLLHKIWNKENNGFHNSITHCSFRQKESSSLLFFFSYNIPISSLLLRKKPCKMRHLVISLQSTASFCFVLVFFFFCHLFFFFLSLKADWSSFFIPSVFQRNNFSRVFPGVLSCMSLYTQWHLVFWSYSLAHNEVPENSFLHSLSEHARSC